jgi:hypothetical protein
MQMTNGTHGATGITVINSRLILAHLDFGQLRVSSHSNAHLLSG